MKYEKIAIILTICFAVIVASYNLANGEYIVDIKADSEVVEIVDLLATNMNQVIDIAVQTDQEVKELNKNLLCYKFTNKSCSELNISTYNED